MSFDSNASSKNLPSGSIRSTNKISSAGEDSDEEEMPNWYGYVKVLFEDLKTHHTYARYYYILFCLRRFLFVVVAMLFFERPWLQAIMYWQISFFALMLLFVGRPFKE